jgi:hypothetical protein
MLKDLKIFNTEKFQVAQALISCYLGSRQGLRELGILRSDRNLQGDYAEWFVVKFLNLKLAKSIVLKGFDATDRKERTYQIKARIVDGTGKNTSFDIVNIRNRFDYLIGVFFSRSLEILQIIQVPYEVVAEMCKENKDNYRFRWNKKAMVDQRIKRLLNEKTI